MEQQLERQLALNRVERPGVPRGVTREGGPAMEQGMLSALQGPIPEMQAETVRAAQDLVAQVAAEEGPSPAALHLMADILEREELM